MTSLQPRVPTDPEVGATLIEAARVGDFARTLLSAAQHIDDVAEVFAYSVPHGGRPRAICSSGGLCNSAECAENYSRAYYRFDPAMRMLEQVRGRTGFADCFAAASITRADYRAQCFEQPRFVDKVCFGWRGEREAMVLAFYRNRARGTDDLARLADHGLAALAHHQAAALRAQSEPLVARLERRLRGAYGELSGREVEVCARTLAGWTADETARDLGLGLGTVLTYRQRGYQRFGYSRAADFLERLLD